MENAIDFASGEVRITARYDARSITIEVRDDGPGFDPDIFPRLGEPYVTSRAEGEPSGDGHVGMGLGLFIAKTLLERTGARVTFANGRPAAPSSPPGGLVRTWRHRRRRRARTNRSRALAAPDRRATT